MEFHHLDEKADIVPELVLETAGSLIASRNTYLREIQTEFALVGGDVKFRH